MTPVPGNEKKTRSVDKNKLKELHDFLQKTDETQQQIQDCQDQDEREKLQYFFPYNWQGRNVKSMGYAGSHPPEYFNHQLQYVKHYDDEGN